MSFVKNKSSHTHPKLDDLQKLATRTNEPTEKYTINIPVSAYRKLKLQASVTNKPISDRLLPLIIQYANSIDTDELINILQTGDFGDE
jgi:hypothetical protein